MINRPVHQNLDTSFVNLSALVRYLRRREFVGRVRLEFNSYEADIVLEEGNTIKVREHDKIVGRIAEGEEALQRLLIRAREAGGTIHVYQFVKAIEPVKGEKTETPKIEIPKAETPQIQTVVEAKPVQKELVTELPQISAAQPKQNGTNGSATKPIKLPEIKAIIPPKPNGLKIPFELKNSVEDRARNNQINPQDWQLLLNLTSELLGNIDKTLSDANLDFKAAFTKSRSEIAPDYPFLSPATKIFAYSNGKISMKEQVNAKLYAAGINEALRRILEKLGANPKFAETYRATTQKITALINHRKPLYEKFFITPQLKKIIGT